MKKLLNKWYFSLILLPLIVNYVTQIFDSEFITTDWKNTFIFTLIIICSVLIVELKAAIELSKLPKEIDKEKIKILLSKLDINSFQMDIYQADSMNGYPQQAIIKVIDFLENADLLQLKTSDKRLNFLIQDFAQQLDAFSYYSGRHLMNNDPYFVPISKWRSDANEELEEETNRMNELAKMSYLKLEKLMHYLRERNYL